MSISIDVCTRASARKTELALKQRVVSEAFADIGKVAVFLASDESYCLTGQLIRAAGGVKL
jgi:hypothetical protein